MNKQILNVLETIRNENNFEPTSSQHSIIEKISYFIDTYGSSANIKRLFLKKKIGVYLHGPAGRGKTVIMNAFSNLLTRKISNFFHFNEFIFRLQKLDMSDEKKFFKKLKENNIVHLDQKFIFIDELEINNIADIIILKKFISTIEKKKIKIFFTSNFSPKNLYSNNHHKKKITEIIDIFNKKFEILKLDTKLDYRIKNSSLSSFIFDNTKKNNNKNMNALKKKLTNAKIGILKNIKRPGHTFKLKKFYGELLECEFEDICGSNLNFKDYLFLMESINFIFIKNVPMLNKEINDKLKRFIHLIDAIYEKKKILSISTIVKFDKIYLKTHNNLNFKRTHSRLSEILSMKYILENAPKKNQFLYLDDING